MNRRQNNTPKEKRTNHSTQINGINHSSHIRSVIVTNDLERAFEEHAEPKHGRIFIYQPWKHYILYAGWKFQTLAPYRLSEVVILTIRSEEYELKEIVLTLCQKSQQKYGNQCIRKIIFCNLNQNQTNCKKCSSLKNIWFLVNYLNEKYALIFMTCDGLLRIDDIILEFSYNIWSNKW